MKGWKKAGEGISTMDATPISVTDRHVPRRPVVALLVLCGALCWLSDGIVEGGDPALDLLASKVICSTKVRLSLPSTSFDQNGCSVVAELTAATISDATLFVEFAPTLIEKLPQWRPNLTVKVMDQDGRTLLVGVGPLYAGVDPRWYDSPTGGGYAPLVPRFWHSALNKNITFDPTKTYRVTIALTFETPTEDCRGQVSIYMASEQQELCGRLVRDQ